MPAPGIDECPLRATASRMTGPVGLITLNRVSALTSNADPSGFLVAASFSSLLPTECIVTYIKVPVPQNRHRDGEDGSFVCCLSLRDDGIQENTTQGYINNDTDYVSISCVFFVIKDITTIGSNSNAVIRIDSESNAF